MMAWTNRLKGDPLAWLLESDPVNPAIRCFALRDLLDRPADDPETQAARAAMMTTGPVPAILDAQHADGYWERPGGGCWKYRQTVWQVMFLSELGADPSEAWVRQGCAYVLDHSRAPTGGFSFNRTPAPGSVVHCLTGNLLAA
jgi:hypothetical protein